MTVSLAAAFAVPGATAPRPGRLVAFGSCPDLLGYVKAHAAPFVTAYGLGRPAGLVAGPGVPGVAAPASGSTPQQGVDYSGTNVQEAGVDEPDPVKTNGVTLFAVENGQLEAVAVGGVRPKLLDTLKLDSGWSHELLLFRVAPAGALAGRLLDPAAARRAGDDDHAAALELDADRGGRL